MNDHDGKVKEKLLVDPEADINDDEKKKEDEKEKKKEKKEKRSIWRDFIDIDFYDLFKQLSPIIPTLPSVYAILISMFRDESHSSIANWYKVLDFIENLNICLYSISATIFYKIFKKKKKNQDKVRMKLALTVEKLNKLFLIYCFLISGAKLVLGIILPAVDGVPDDQTVGLFIFSLFAKLGLIVAQLFYLYTVYIKKYYKSLPILEDATDDGFVNESKKNNDGTDEKGKDRLEYLKKKMKEKEKKKKKKPDEKNQQEDIIQALKKENEEKAKTNERLLGMVENLSKASENWSDFKEEFSTLKELNFILLKFAKPLLDDVKLTLTNEMANNGDGSSLMVVIVKVTDKVQDVKHRIRSQLGSSLSEKATKLILKTNHGEELKDDDFVGKYDLEEGLKLTYSIS